MPRLGWLKKLINVKSIVVAIQSFTFNDSGCNSIRGVYIDVIDVYFACHECSLAYFLIKISANKFKSKQQSENILRALSIA
jgi:hypothetical protein